MHLLTGGMRHQAWDQYILGAQQPEWFMQDLNEEKYC
jgi:hypothetical protein